MFKDDPITGQGPNAFRYLCSEKKFYVDLGCTTHPHQIYIQLLAETGIPGFMFLFITLIFVIWKLIYIFIANYKSKYFQYNKYSEFFILLAIFINLFPFVPSNNFFNNWINIMYFLPIGLYLGVFLKNIDE